MLNIIISEGRADDSPDRKLEQELARQLSERSECRVAIVPHLYDLPADGQAMGHLQAVEGDMVVFSWLYPRAAYWVLAANKIAGRMGRTRLFPVEELEPAAKAENDAARTIWCIDLRARPEPAPFLDEIEALLQSSGHTPPEPVAAVSARRVEEPTAYRWYPVIDYRRCESCLECLNFCLFGVFGLDENQTPVVEQPDACRDGCPACARICPSQAIMFPQHNDRALAGNGAAANRLPNADAQGRAETERKRAQRPRTDLDRLVDDVDGMDV